MIAHEHPIGASVEVRAPSGLMRWVPATVMRHGPYLSAPGYYVSYPGATEMWHCSGGWHPAQCVRAVAP